MATSGDRACLQEFVHRKLPVMAVLLPGAPDNPAIPLFPKQLTWVDLRQGLSDESISTLVWGISGKKRDVSDAAPVMQRAHHAREIREFEPSLPTIGVVTALPVEFAAMRTVLRSGRWYAPAAKGGSTGLPRCVPHLVAKMPSHCASQIWVNSAAVRATLLLTHFPSIQHVIMTGIAGGVPYPSKAEHNVRLGDVVISDKKGVIQYDFDKETADGAEIRRSPIPPSAALLESLRLLKASELEGARPWDKIMRATMNKLGWQRPDESSDVLVSAQNPNQVVPHPDDPNRHVRQPRIFIGPIASANKLLKNAAKREAVREAFGVKAVEMEGSGIADASWAFECAIWWCGEFVTIATRIREMRGSHTPR